MRKFPMAFLPMILAAGPLALAAPQPKPPVAMPAPSAGTAADVSAATMHKFASAYEDVMQVRAKYMGRVTSTTNSGKKAAIKQQATNEMKQHISRYMPVAEYIKVGKEINASPVLRQRLMTILQADRKTMAGAAGTGG